MGRVIYLDNHSTRQMNREVINAMMPYMEENFSNPSASHNGGKKARAAIENARVNIASLLNAKPSEIYFTSGSAESNNTCIKGTIAASKKHYGKVICAATEPLSVLNPVRSMESNGLEMETLSVNGKGVINIDGLAEKLETPTVLVTVSMASNEIGTVQPIVKAASVASEKGIHFHMDASSIAGMAPIDLQELGVSSASFSAHRFGGPKGVGVFYLKQGIRMKPLIHGGIQESGLRAGTENVPAIVGMSEALTLKCQHMKENRGKLWGYAKRLKDEISGQIDEVGFTGHETDRIPGHLSFVVPGLDGEALIMELSARGIHASSGSVCRAGANKLSHVLKAIGLSDEAALGAVVMSADISNDQNEIPQVVEALKESIAELKSL